MTLQDFLPLFTWTLIPLGSLAVCGWYAVTRGEKETLPDGSIKKKGQLFKAWYFFWTKTKGKKRIYYSQHPLKWLYVDYLTYYPNNDYGLIFPEKFDEQVFSAALEFKSEMFSERFAKDIEKIKSDLQVEILHKGMFVSFYKEYDEYVFPEWVRKPLAECATCFASVYGSLFYWPVAALSKLAIFDWSIYPKVAAIFFWGVFCFSLAVLNTFIAKKVI